MKTEKHFNELKASLGEALEHARGKITLRSRKVVIPEKPKPLSPEEIKGLREELGVSQGLFARFLNVSRDTAISWEQGRRQPSGAALKLLRLFKEHPELVRETAGHSF